MLPTGCAVSLRSGYRTTIAGTYTASYRALLSVGRACRYRPVVAMLA